METKIKYHVMEYDVSDYDIYDISVILKVNFVSEQITILTDKRDEKFVFFESDPNYAERVIKTMLHAVKFGKDLLDGHSTD